MNPLLNDLLTVRLHWATPRHWKAGQSLAWPVETHTLWLMLEGQVELHSGDNCWPVEASQIFLWPKHLPRRIVGITDAHWLTIGLSAASPSHPDLFAPLPLPGAYTPKTTDRFPIAHWLKNLVELNNYAKPNHIRPTHLDIIEDSMARAIFAWCWGIWGTADLSELLNQQNPAWLTKTLQAIAADPAISIAQLAKVASFSPAQFRRLFHQYMNQAPQTYLLNHRLEIAQRLLITTDLSIDEVAIRSGFSTPTNFMKLWKRARGLAALQYRRGRHIPNA